ncbi:MAG: hypothetical protein K2O28_00735 [Clostridia bacterium]|nr:hypothetical protein [Clostridia bacterium]
MKSKKWLALLLSAAMVVPVALAGCGNGTGNEGGNGGNDGGEGGNGGTNEPPAQPTSVSAPTVSMTGNILSWNEVKDAECYSVHYILDGQDFLISEKQQGTTFVFNPKEVGEYSFYVVAINQTYNLASENSATVSFNYEADKSVALASSAKIYVVGDSTVCDFNDGYYLPRKGYGTQLHNYINCEKSQIVNLAISGRSSKSFLSESNYTTLKTSITAGDYLIIGFGHNDEKSDDAARFTSAKGDKNTAGSFQNSLYENYVKLAKDKGATPILCTPIVRYDSTNKYTGSVAHVTADGDYPEAIRTLGKETETTVIDLTKITKDLYQADNEAAQYYHAHTTYKSETDKTPSGRDSTHINEYGAKMISYMFANSLINTDCSLKTSVITNALAPTYAVDFTNAINTKYVKPAYNAFDESANASRKLAEITTNSTTSNWYKTVMGNVGGASKLSNFTISHADNVFTVGTDTNSGKFENKSDGTGVDGFGAAFTQVSAAKNFTVSAHVKVKSINSASVNGQTGFGLMLRDDMYLDYYATDLASNYVAAGILGNKTAIFSREKAEEGTTLTAESNSAAASVNSEYELTIVRVGQSVNVTVKVVGGSTYTKNYTDFDFNAIDNEYMYVCLFATRGDIVEFSNVQFEITGESQGA